ncbi:HU family DNA-binding protein [Candidatus Woesebacteria bacterium]|nr:MAG: HU family DNA-binding protein [Candidatus Woesebacteria bacterium]
MAKMKKGELIEIVARKAHMPKRAATEAVEVIFDEIGRFLSKGVDSKVLISGFGTFKTIRMEGKTVKIPNTEKLVNIKPHPYPSFTPGKKLKRQVKK